MYRSRIPDLGSRISDWKPATRGRKIYFPTFFCSPKYHKILFFLTGTKIFLSQFTKSTFHQKTCDYALKNKVWDLGSEIRTSEKTFSGSQIQGVKTAANAGSATLTRRSSCDNVLSDVAAGLLLSTKILYTVNILKLPLCRDPLPNLRSNKYLLHKKQRSGSV